MKRRFLAIGVPLFAILLTLSSCTKEPLENLTADESRIYITNFDSTVNFRNYRTFSIVDSVAVIKDNKLQGKQVAAYDVRVINAIRSAMQQKGFTLVQKSAQPDLGINVSRITNTYTGVVSYPDYWGYYNSFYDPFYWGYPGFNYYSPYSYGIYQVNEGALSIDMLDLKGAASNGNTIKPVWTALARGTGVFNEANADTQVQAFFSQSPYLITGN